MYFYPDSWGEFKLTYKDDVLTAYPKTEITELKTMKGDFYNNKMEGLRLDKTMSYEEVSKYEGFTVEELMKGYAVFSIGDGIKVIQKIDCLDQYGLSKFETDTEAGEQALKDGLPVAEGTGELEGWYVLQD